MPPKKGKKMSGRAAARLQVQASVNSSLSTSTIMARMAQRRLIVQALATLNIMARDVLVIIMDYASETKVSYALVGGGPNPAFPLFFLTLAAAAATATQPNTNPNNSSGNSSSTSMNHSGHGIPQLTHWRHVPSAIYPSGANVAIPTHAVTGSVSALLPSISLQSLLIPLQLVVP
jgi:hypothetical protein